MLSILERFKFSGRFLPLVSMMQSTDGRQIDYLAFADRSGLDQPTVGRIFSKAQVRSVVMIIFEICTKNVKIRGRVRF